MDYNKLIKMIKELSGADEIKLTELRKDGSKIYIELEEMEAVDPSNELIEEK